MFRDVPKLVLLAVSSLVLVVSGLALPSAATAPGAASGAGTPESSAGALVTGASDIHGLVVDKYRYSEGSPARLDGVVVEAYLVSDPDGEPVASDLTYARTRPGGAQHGYFRLEVPPGDYVVRYSPAEDDVRPLLPGSYRRGDTVTVGEGEAVRLNRYAMRRASGDFTGRVVDSAGEPIDGVRLTFTSERHGFRFKTFTETVTDGGEFTVTLPPVSYRVRVNDGSDRQGYHKVRYGWERAASARTKDLGEITLIAPGGAQGLVTDEAGTPLNDVQVWFYNEVTDSSRWARTGPQFEGDGTADGAFAVELDPGSYQIQFYGDDVDSEASFGDVTYHDGELVEIPSGAYTTLDTVVLPELPVAQVRGLVLDQDGAPLGDAGVDLYRVGEGGTLEYVDSTYTSDGSSGGACCVEDRARTAVTPLLDSDEEGVYTFRGVQREQTYTIQASYGDQTRWLGNVESSEDADTFVIDADTRVFEVPTSIALTTPCRGRVISNGTVSLGVNCLGQLNLGRQGVGLQYDPTGNDGTQAGCECEGWGVADASTGARGYANNSAGTDGLELESFVVDADKTTATSTVLVGDTFRVTHEYVPSPESDNVYEVNVSVENISDEAADLRYRRVMDWDVEPTPFDEYVTMVTGDARELVFASNDGFASANPLAGPSDIGHVGDFTDEGPDDHGALFDFQFPSLAPGETQDFQTFYGAAGDESSALAGLAAVQAEAYSLGQPSTENGPTLGTPNTFLFGFAGVGGGSVLQPPTAHDDVLDAISELEAEIDVLDNDTDPNRRDVLAVVDESESDPEHGSVTCESDGSCTYTSDPGYSGPDWFTYVVTDGAGGVDTGLVSVTVYPEPAAEPAGAPLVEGDAVVGGLLMTTDGTWSRSDLDFSYRWLRDGTVIEDATDSTYMPVADDLDAEIQSRVIATRSGAAPVSQDSLPLDIGEGAALQPIPGHGPSIPASVRNGDRVTVDPGHWSPEADEYSFQWTLDGVDIPFATSGHLVLTDDHVDGVLAVDVVAHRDGHADGAAPSNGAPVVRSAAPTNYELPVIRGVAAAGETLEAEAGSWSFPIRELDPTYQWERNGLPIPTATGQLLDLGTVEVAEGDLITVVVTVHRDGHEDGTAESLPVEFGSVAGTNERMPLITGTPRVGERLTLDPGDWSDGVTLTHQWFATPTWATGEWARYYRYRIWEADDSATLDLPAWTAGYLISVDQTATGAPGSTPVTVTTASVGPVQDLPRLYYDRSATITGVPQVGQPLGIDNGTWFSYAPDGSVTDVSPDSFSYEWYVDGERVSTTDSFTPLERHAGRPVYVYLTAHEAGHYDGWGYGYLSRIRFLDEGVGTLDLTVQRATAPRNPVPGSTVTICRTGAWDCQWFTTDSRGVPQTAGAAPLELVATPAGVDYTVSVSPPYDSGLLARADTVTVVRGETTAFLSELEGLLPMPSTAEISAPNGTRDVDTDGDGDSDGSYPSVYYSTPQTLTIEGCANVVDPAWTVVFSNGAAPMRGDLTEGPDGTYTGTIPGFSSTGLATIETNVPPTCGGAPTEFTVYIDPSGIVTDQFGRAIEGAQVTLLRREGASFTPVADGDTAVMDPAVNTSNPSRTTATGFFRWDVTPGDYKVSVSDARSGGVLCDVTTTNAMSVPPARVDLLIKVPCASASQPAPVVAPVLTGTARVGEVLSATGGVWGDGLEVEAIQWLRDGAVVGSGSTYALTAADVGEVITARVTARRPDYVQENGSGTVVSFDPARVDLSSATVVAAPGGGGGGGATAPVNTAVPTVGGVVKVGNSLTAHPGTWNTTGLTFAYQWLRDGEPIEGATTADYVPVVADLGKSLSVKVTAGKAGVPSATAVSSGSTVLIGDPATVLSPPIITGGTGLGDLLSVSDGSWSGSGLAFTYQWFRDDAAIPGATGKTWTIVTEDQGADLTARVTAARAGHEDGVAVSAPIAVPIDGPGERDESRTRATLSKDTYGPTERPRLTVRVVSLGDALPVGALRVRVDGQTVKSVRLGEAADGVRRVRLPRLDPGKHAVRAVFAGSEELRGSRSDKLVLRVTKEHHRVLPSLH